VLSGAAIPGAFTTADLRAYVIAAENVAMVVGVGWHRQRADAKIAAGLRRLGLAEIPVVIAKGAEPNRMGLDLRRCRAPRPTDRHG
jgi:hypothetical protein